MKDSDNKVESFNGRGGCRDNIVPLKNHLYINPSDPLYYEKILQYIDKNSPEAHYHLGHKHIERNNRAKAAYHFTECMRIYSPYYHKAKADLMNLEKEPAGSGAGSGSDEPEDGSSIINYKRAILILSGTLAASLLFLVLLIFYASPDRHIALGGGISGVGLDVIYETTEKPFLIYIPYDTPSREVEKLLYSKALELGAGNPKLNVQIYGIYSSSDSSAEGANPLPLRNAELKKRAFVLAEYHADTDETVRIRFMNTTGSAETHYVANMVRTALLQYEEDHGELPDHIQELLGDYPDNYLSVLPPEPATGSSRIVPEYDGAGGWVYRPGSPAIEGAFLPNTPVQQIPYYPIELVVSKEKHTLRVVNGPYQYSEFKAGIGRDDRTPEGGFEILDRVRSPRGAKKGIYGDAGLGFGKFALHGTNDRSSVGRNVSLGCVRLLNEDIAMLFPAVPKGAVVRISSEDRGSSETYRAASLASIHFPAPRNRERAENDLFMWLG